MQTIHIATERNPVKRYNDGLRTALAFLLLVIVICVLIIVLTFHNPGQTPSNLEISNYSLQLAAAIVSLIACISMPRRPTVSDLDHVVDGQYTVSAISSYTFGFAGRVLSLARRKSSLDLVDLPKLHFWVRSSFLLHRSAASSAQTNRLWKSIIYRYYPEILFQTAWASMQSALQFAPQFAMYKLLQLLEQRSQGAPVENAAWGLVVVLGGSIILASWTQAWEYWICWARLGQPIRTELSALVFSKSLRRKDVKDASKGKKIPEAKPSDIPVVTTNDPGGASQTDPISRGEAGDDDLRQNIAKNAAKFEGNEDIQETRQSTINLVVGDHHQSRLSCSLTEIQLLGY